jgi:hypothetical protein
MNLTVSEHILWSYHKETLDRFWSYQFYRNLPFWPAYYIEIEDILIMKMVWNEERMIKLCCKH